MLKNRKANLNTAYLIYGEDIIGSGIIRNQVIPLLKELAERLDVKIFLISVIRENFNYDQNLLAEMTSELEKYSVIVKIYKDYEFRQTIDTVGSFLKKNNVAIIHARAYFGSFYAYSIKEKFGIPFIFDTRGLMPEETKLIRAERAGYQIESDERYYKDKQLEHILVHNAAENIVVNNPCLEYYKKYYPKIDNFQIIELFADLQKFSFSAIKRREFRQKLGLENKTVLVFSGTFATPWYDVDVMLSWFLQLLSKNNNFFLLVLTYQDDSNSQGVDLLKSKIGQYGISNSKVLIDSGRKKDMQGYLSAADIACIPFKKHYQESLKVAQAIKFTEYLSNGLPVINCDYSMENVEIIQKNDGSGWILKDGIMDHYNLDKIMEWLDNYRDDLTMRERISSIAKKQNYTLSSSAGKYEKLYRDLLDLHTEIEESNYSPKAEKGESAIYLTLGDDILKSGILKTQVFPLLENLGKKLQISLILVNIIRPEMKYNQHKLSDLKKKLASLGIELLIIKDVNVNDTITSLGRVIVDNNVKLIHARSYYASVYANYVKQKFNIPFIFDTRGLMPEETYLFRNQQRGYEIARNKDEQYKKDKAFEKELVENALSTVTVNKQCTKYYQDYYPSFDNISSINLFTDSDKFAFNPQKRENIRRAMGWQDKIVMVFPGSLETAWYDPEVLLDWFSTIYHYSGKKAVLLILTYGSENGYISSLKNAVTSLGYSDKEVVINANDDKDIAGFLAASDVACIPFSNYYKFTLYYAQAIKFTEYLTSGLFVLCCGYSDEIKSVIKVNPFCGEIAEDGKLSQVAAQRIVDLFDKENDIQKITELRKRIARVAADRDYSLESSAGKYLKIYEKVFKVKSDAKNLTDAISKPVVGYLSPDAYNFACPYIRLHAPLTLLDEQGKIEFLQLQNFDDRKFSVNNEFLPKLDILVVQRHLAMYYPYNQLMAAFGEKKPKLIFEIDDFLTGIIGDKANPSIFQQIRPLMEEHIAKADLVTVSTELLKTYYLDLNPNIVVLPNTLDLKLWKNDYIERKNDDGVVKILFSGTMSHESDLQEIEEAIIKISEEYGKKVKFLFWGNITEEIRNLDNVEEVYSYTPDYFDYVKKISELEIDFALVPLADNKFNRAKSNIKWLEYCISSIPAVYSNIEAYRESVVNNVTGILASNDCDSWYRSIKLLIDNENIRHRIAKTAYHTVKEKFNLSAKIDLWNDVYTRELRNQGDGMTSSSKTENKQEYLSNIFKNLSKRATVRPEASVEDSTIGQDYKGNIFSSLGNKQPVKQVEDEKVEESSYAGRIFSSLTGKKDLTDAEDKVTGQDYKSNIFSSLGNKQSVKKVEDEKIEKSSYAGRIFSSLTGKKDLTDAEDKRSGQDYKDNIFGGLSKSGNRVATHKITEEYKKNILSNLMKIKKPEVVQSASFAEKGNKTGGHIFDRLNESVKDFDNKNSYKSNIFSSLSKKAEKEKAGDEKDYKQNLFAGLSSSKLDTAGVKANYQTRIFSGLQEAEKKSKEDDVKEDEFIVKAGYFIGNETEEQLDSLIKFLEELTNNNFSMKLFFDKVDESAKFAAKKATLKSGCQLEFEYDYKLKEADRLIDGLNMIISLDDNEEVGEIVSQAIKNEIFTFSIATKELNEMIATEFSGYLTVVDSFDSLLRKIGYVLRKPEMLNR